VFEGIPAPEFFSEDPVSVKADLPAHAQAR